MESCQDCHVPMQLSQDEYGGGKALIIMNGSWICKRTEPGIEYIRVYAHVRCFLAVLTNSCEPDSKFYRVDATLE